MTHREAWEDQKRFLKAAIHFMDKYKSDSTTESATKKQTLELVLERMLQTEKMFMD